MCARHVLTAFLASTFPLCLCHVLTAAMPVTTQALLIPHVRDPLSKQLILLGQQKYIANPFAIGRDFKQHIYVLS